MDDRNYIQRAGIGNSFEVPRPYPLKRLISFQNSLTTSHVNTDSTLRRHHSFQSHCSSKNNPRCKSVIHVTHRRPSKNSIRPIDNGLSDYNSQLQMSTMAIQATRRNRKTSIGSNISKNLDESPQNIHYSDNIAGLNQHYGSFTQCASGTVKSDFNNQHSKNQNNCSPKINNKTNVNEKYYPAKPTTNSKYWLRLTNATSSTNVSSCNFRESGNFAEVPKKVQHSIGRKPVDERKRNSRRRRCLGGYCCPCTPLCTFFSLLAALLLAAVIAALVITFIKPNSVATSIETTTMTSTTTTSATTTTSSSTSTATTSTTTTTSSTSTATTSTTSTETTSTTSTTTTSSSTTTMTTSTTSSTTSTTTTPRPMCRITQPGDFIEGLYNTTAGGSTGGFDGRYSPYSQTPDKAIDNDMTTKYLNYGANGTMNLIQVQPGAGTGFYVSPASSTASMANGLLFGTGDDYPERDPLTVTLEGTNSTALNISSSWTLIYTGPTGINASIAPNRSTYGTLQIFPNTIAYRSYRLLMTSQRDAQDSIQYAESNIMTYC